MKISINIDYPVYFNNEYLNFIKLKELLKILNKIGFTHINISSEFSRFLISEADEIYLNKFKGLLADFNFKIDWIHVPFFNINLYTTDYELWSVSVSAAKKVIDVGSFLNAKNAVIHPVMGTQLLTLDDNCMQYLIKAFIILFNYGKEKNVTTAIENLIDDPVHDIIQNVLDNIPELSLCFDTGHAEISGTWELYFSKYAHRICALHIHDNDGKIDDHRIPGDGVINYENFFYLLQKNNYSNVYGFECVQKKSNFPGTPEEIASRIYNFIIQKNK
ncbi:MAG: sugar phosphate isomerase/epimerase [Spirochaetes bacterium]|nr:sugar phosphate isomerase/epimerase [Spirochaetota bacterium]